MSRLKWVLVGVVGLLAGLIGFLCMAQIQHWRADEANLHIVVSVIEQNLRQGVLHPLSPPPSPQPPVVP